MFCIWELLKVLSGSCKRNLQPTNEQTTNTLSVTMNVSKLCMVVFVSYMFSISLFTLSQPSLWSGHICSTSKSFPNLNHPLSLSHFFLLTRGCWGSDPRLADSATVMLTFLVSSLSSTILSDLLFSAPYFTLNCKYSVYEHIWVSRQFFIITHTWFAIWFPSKRMSPTSNVTASPKHQCKQHFERWCTGKLNKTELCCLGIKKFSWA